MMTKFLKKLRTINQVYSYLSSDFVHFSTDALPDRKPEPLNSTSGNVVLWGFEGISFFISLTRPIIDYYFEELTKQVRQLKRVKK